jgi:ubiquinone/menaquinone biosynthesis C-methylase UbiE
LGSSVDYDALAPTYERRYARDEYAGVERALLRFVGPDPALRVLEVGCGTGHWTGLLAARGFAVAGLDASPGMLRRAARRGDGSLLAVGSAERLPWADARFDRILCVNAFHHFEGKRACLAEARRVLRPGGGFFTVGIDPHTGLDRWCVYDYFAGTLETDLRRYPPTSRIRAWLAEAGFEGSASEVVQHVELDLPAAEALDHWRLARSTTSQLALLSEAAYAAGIERIRRDAAAAEAAGGTLRLGADLRLYATSAWKPRRGRP